MNDSIFDQSLQKRESFLERIISEKTAALDGCLPGKLRIVRRGKQTYYYWRATPQETSGHYISRSNYQIAKALAQKSYDQEILHVAEEELTLVKKIRSKLSLQSVESCSLILSETYQELIEPAVLSDATFAKLWMDTPYQQKEYIDDEKELYTKHNERVRSKSELLIANALNDYHIPYRYECACFLKGYGYVYPDFTALNVRKRKEFLWEHMGMMDDMNYMQKALRKISLYEKNGFYPGDKLIITHETSTQPLGSKLINDLIQTFLL